MKKMFSLILNKGMSFCTVVMLLWVFYRACDRSYRVPCAKQDTQSHHNKSFVEFQNEADDTDAKARTQREVMSPRPTKTLSVQIKLHVRRPNTFNYSKYHHRRFHGLTSDKWNANQAALC